MLKSFLIKSFITIKDLLYTYKLTFQYRRVIKQKTKNKPKKLNKTQISEIKKFYSKFGYHKLDPSYRYQCSIQDLLQFPVFRLFVL